MPTLERLDVVIGADAAPLRKELQTVEKELGGLEGLAGNFASSITGALESAVVSGRDLSDVLRRLALDLSRSAFRSALQPLEASIGSGFSGAAGGLSRIFSNLFSGLTAFADGGVIGAPTMFPLGGGRLGLAGEAGPEAVLPLSRGADGRLGVAMQGSAAPQITFNVTAQDVDSFRRSQGQIEAMLSRAVARGQRNL